MAKVLNQIRPKNKKEYGGALFNRAVPAECGKLQPALWLAWKQAVNIYSRSSSGACVNEGCSAFRYLGCAVKKVYPVAGNQAGRRGRSRPRRP